MVKKLKKEWIEGEIQEIKELLMEQSSRDIGGPSSVLRYGRGKDYEELGTLYKLIGDHTQSKEYYLQASHTYYLYDESTPLEGWHENTEVYSYKYEGARIQLKAAICSFLGKDVSRSEQLFAWALENLDAPKHTLDFWKPRGEGEDKTYGQIYLFQAYALARLQDYQGSLEKATEAQDAFQYFKNKNEHKVYKEDRYPVRILIELAKYKLNPTEEQKLEAQIALKAYADACQQDIDGIMNFLYIYDFQEAYPDVFEPVLPN